MTTFFDGWAYDGGQWVRDGRDLPDGVTLWRVVCEGPSQRRHNPNPLALLFDRRETEHRDVIAVTNLPVDGQSRRERQRQRSYSMEHYPQTTESGGTVFLPRCRVQDCPLRDEVQIGQRRLGQKLDALQAYLPTEAPRVVELFMLR